MDRNGLDVWGMCLLMKTLQHNQGYLKVWTLTLLGKFSFPQGGSVLLKVVLFVSWTEQVCEFRVSMYSTSSSWNLVVEITIELNQSKIREQYTWFKKRLPFQTIRPLMVDYPLWVEFVRAMDGFLTQTAL